MTPTAPLRSLLLADDDDEVRLGIADLLGRIGLEVVQAQTGLEALSIVRTRQVQAALLDHHMPGCTGLEALSRIQALRVGLPCIVYSGRLTTGLERSLFDAGACAVLKKPIQPDLLKREVLRAIACSPYDWTEAPNAAASNIVSDSDIPPPQQN